MKWNGIDDTTVNDDIAYSSVKNDKVWRRSLFIKIGTSFTVLIIVFVIAKAQTPLMQNISHQLRAAMSLDVDVDENLGKSKFIENVLPGVKQVLSDNEDDVFSDVIKNYEETNQNGAVFNFPENKEIKALDNGIIIENTGRQLGILQSDGILIKYDGCKEAPLGVGVRVNKGDLVAVSDSGGLRISVFNSGIQTDPISYIEGLGDY